MNQPPKQLLIHHRRTIRIQHSSTTRNQHPTSRRNITIMNTPTRRARPRTNIQTQFSRQHKPAIRTTTSRTLKRAHDNSRRSLLQLPQNPAHHRRRNIRTIATRLPRSNLLILHYNITELPTQQTNELIHRIPLTTLQTSAFTNHHIQASTRRPSPPILTTMPLTKQLIPTLRILIHIRILKTPIKRSTIR